MSLHEGHKQENGLPAPLGSSSSSHLAVSLLPRVRQACLFAGRASPQVPSCILAKADPGGVGIATSDVELLENL